MRTFTMDGNFSAQHAAMRKPDDDVSLSDGNGFMVGSKRYQDHLAQAIEDTQVRLHPPGHSFHHTD
jgi:hypothetical protein